MKKILILLTVLSFSCKKKSSSPAPADNPPVQSGPVTQTISVFAKNNCSGGNGYIKIDWDGSMTKPPINDSIYPFINPGITTTRVNKSDTLKIGPMGSVDGSNQFCPGVELTISVNGTAIKTFTSPITITYIKLQ